MKQALKDVLALRTPPKTRAQKRKWETAQKSWTQTLSHVKEITKDLEVFHEHKTKMRETYQPKVSLLIDRVDENRFDIRWTVQESIWPILKWRLRIIREESDTFYDDLTRSISLPANTNRYLSDPLPFGFTYYVEIEAETALGKHEDIEFPDPLPIPPPPPLQTVLFGILPVVGLPALVEAYVGNPFLMVFKNKEILFYESSHLHAPLSRYSLSNEAALSSVVACDPYYYWSPYNLAWTVMQWNRKGSQQPQRVFRCLPSETILDISIGASPQELWILAWRPGPPGRLLYHFDIRTQIQRSLPNPPISGQRVLWVKNTLFVYAGSESTIYQYCPTRQAWSVFFPSHSWRWSSFDAWRQCFRDSNNLVACYPPEAKAYTDEPSSTTPHVRSGGFSFFVPRFPVTL